MDILGQIENHHRFALPAAYRAFAERGLLTYPGPAYLWVNEAEWIPLPQMVSYDWSYANPKPGLVPFAFTGGASLCCWQTRRVTEFGEPAIVFCPRDCYEGDWYAPSFAGWLYRVALDYALSIDDENEGKTHIANWANAFREFGKQSWYDDLLQVIQRQPFRHPIGRRAQVVTGLLTHQELQERIRVQLGLDYLDARYIWDVDGESDAG